MSLYNLLNGVSPATFFILPMLGRHPDEYPRFRDCFIKDADHPEYDGHIHVYTRTGGGNREAYESENQSMMDMEWYVTDHDDDFDCTYATWVFRVPERWLSDYNYIVGGEFSKISDEYKEQMKLVYPKLSDRFDEIFSQFN